MHYGLALIAELASLRIRMCSSSMDSAVERYWDRSSSLLPSLPQHSIMNDSARVLILSG